MLVIGLTGGIGSGKSTAAQLFSERGVPIIDADQIARALTTPDQFAFQKIVEQFGPSILQIDGNLNRSALRKIIFTDKNKKHWLENLLHPLIRAEIKKQIQKLTSSYCIIVIPLLLETEPYPFIDRILVINSTESEQIKRVQLRDKTAIKDIQAIIKTQASQVERLAAADDVIQNDAHPTHLISQVDKLHNFYSILAKQFAKK